MLEKIAIAKLACRRLCGGLIRVEVVLDEEGNQIDTVALDDKCPGCKKKVEENDFLFYIPKEMLEYVTDLE